MIIRLKSIGINSLDIELFLSEIQLKRQFIIDVSGSSIIDHHLNLAG